jgi:hypothetical protein
MAAATRLLASAVVGGLMVGGVPSVAQAQAAARSPVLPVARLASFAAGSILGVVEDESGAPVDGVVVSALGATTLVTVTDKDGRFEFGTLAPGPYIVRAHISGYLSPKPQTIHVSPSIQSVSAISLKRLSDMAPVLAAGVASGTSASSAAPPDQPAASDAPDDDSHSETVWRIRHARRGVLKDVAIPAEWLVDAEGADDKAVDLLGRSVGSSARAASNFFVDTPFSGQVNLLTTGSFDAPEQLFSVDNLSRNIAYMRVGAPVGDQADWTVSGALTQADISSWIVAGRYTTRASARHRYDLGLSYSTQHYDGGNLLALRDVSDGSRNAGAVYGYDSFAISSVLTLAYGATYARYDYLEGRSLLSPRVEVTMLPAEGLRISAAIARRALAPGAEEFLPPADSGIWLPPQRTFSSLEPDGSFEAEQTTHAEVAVERDLGTSTVAFRAFRQHIDNQLVTVFGSDLPGGPDATLGHYLVGNAGDANAQGCSVGFRTMIGGRVHGSVEYSVASALLQPDADLRYLMLVAPSRGSAEHIHDLSTSIETEIPETATRVLILYRLSNGFAHADNADPSDRSRLDGRFDVQVRQSLPFMNFSSARWEMLLAVRNFFRETGTDQSLYDELLVVHPPKRIVGGVMLSF